MVIDNSRIFIVNEEINCLLDKLYERVNWYDERFPYKIVYDKRDHRIDEEIVHKLNLLKQYIAEQVTAFTSHA